MSNPFTGEYLVLQLETCVLTNASILPQSVSWLVRIDLPLSLLRRSRRQTPHQKGTTSPRVRTEKPPVCDVLSTLVGRDQPLQNSSLRIPIMDILSSRLQIIIIWD